MNASLKHLCQSLVTKLIVAVGLTLLASFTTWAYFGIKYQQERLKGEMTTSADRLSNTIILGTHYAMMLNSRDDINQIINNIARRKDIENIRIYNKDGKIKFSNHFAEVDMRTNIRDEACEICHRTEPPMVEVGIEQRSRIIKSADGYRRLGIISPIYNEPGCSTSECHFHPQDKKILGALDVVVSLEEIDQEIVFFEKSIIGMALFVFILTSAIISIFVLRFVKHPIQLLVERARRISRGNYQNQIEYHSGDEVGHLAEVINQMAEEIGEQQTALSRQMEEYQNLFEMVPCIITVQNRDYRLVQFNREFYEKFDPKPGDFCFRAYKGRETKCVICPVEKTFEDGKSHTSEEMGVGKDGKPTHWLVKTSPIRNSEGEIVAVMEMNLDITARKKLEEELELSEKKYHTIFNNIPNPVFVLDAETLEVLDCNDSVAAVYGCSKDGVRCRSFLDLFPEEDRGHMANSIRTYAVINQAKQLRKDHKTLFVNIRISPTEYSGRRVLLITTSDITKRLEAEQQLIQASKMATGVAHELNQPLSVIKTASNYFIKKVRKKEPIPEDIMTTMSEEIDSHVDRATKIINHMRQFGRKSDLVVEKVEINSVLNRTFEIFSQQLKVRGIEVEWELADRLPEVKADPDRLEQVFINLLINARDAIMDRLAIEDDSMAEKKIFLITRAEPHKVLIHVCDTGVGIPPGMEDKVFEPFFTTKEVGKGTGLGLSISYGIVKDFGGRIYTKPREGGGACFSIELPA